ncbi:hypothetical protein WIT60_08115 [Aquabacterium sp. G14]
MGDALIKIKIIQKEWTSLQACLHGFAATALTTTRRRSRMPSGGRRTMPPTPLESISQTARLFSRSGVRLEVAQDVIGAIISHHAELIGQEREQDAPRQDRIDEAQGLIRELKDIREALDAHQPASIEATINWLAPLARHLFADGNGNLAAHRRASQFEHANASLRLEGHVMSIDDLVVQARVADGLWTTEQAVSWYRERAKQ